MFRFSSPVTLPLERGRLLTWQRQRGLQLRVLSGSAWVTQAGDPRDHFLQSGQSLELQPGSLAVISAEQDAWLSFEALGGRRWPAAWSRLIRAAAGRHRASAANPHWGWLGEAHAGLP